MLASTILSASGNEDMNVTTALTRLLVHSWDRVSWLGNEACNIEFRCDSIKKKSEQCRAAELVKLKKVTAPGETLSLSLWSRTGVALTRETAKRNRDSGSQ